MVQPRYACAPIGCLLLLLVAGCGARHELRVASLSIDHVGWDTLLVDIGFIRQASLGAGQSISPEALSYVVFNSAYDTLYTGAGTHIVIDDRQLGNQERILVEACGRFGTAKICEQQVITSSPKRVKVVEDVSYPEDADYVRGTYRLGVTVERQQFGAEAWEVIPRPDKLQTYMLAYVGEESTGVVRVPLPRKRGRFDLRDYPNQKDFRFHLNSNLLDQKEVPIHFDFYAAFEGMDKDEPEPLARVEKYVRVRSREERIYEVGTFVEQAADQVIAQLQSVIGVRRSYAFINHWRYNNLTRMYEVEVELTWRTPLFRGNWHELVGRLQVREDGTQPRFHLVSMNRSAARRWNEAVDGNTMALKPLSRPQESP